MVVESFEDIYTRLVNTINANTGKVTDFNKGSVIRSLLEAIANVGHKFYIDTKLGYDNNLKAIPYSIFGFSRKEGQKAVGEVVFNSEKPLSVDTVIPKDTIVRSGNLSFITTEKGVIPKNTTISNKVGIQAAEAGVKYNVDVNAINTINSVVPNNVIGVTNENRTYNGTDLETDSSLQKRFRIYINGLQGGNVYGIQSAVLSLPNVRSCSVEEHIPLKDNVYSFTLWIDDGKGNMSDSLKEEVISIINGDGSQGNPGKRVAGVNFDVSAALSVNIDLIVNVSVERVENELAKSEIKQALENYINSLLIGEDVLISNLIVAIKRLSYVKSADIITNADNRRDFLLDINQIARAGTITVNPVPYVSN